MSRLFGTDGVRGVVNAFLTPELAYHWDVRQDHISAVKRNVPYSLSGATLVFPGLCLKTHWLPAFAP